MKENKLIIKGLTEKGKEIIKAKYKGLRLMKLAFKSAGVSIKLEDNNLIFSSKKRKIEKNKIGMVTQDFNISGCKENIDYKVLTK